MKGGIDVYTGLPILGRPRNTLKKLLKENGQGLVEYALILTTVAILLIVILTWIGRVVVSNLYCNFGRGLFSANGG